MLLTSELAQRPSLVVASPGPLQGTSLALSGARLVVGRGEQADIRIDDPQVSRRHALIDNSEGPTFVVDLGSSHGTTVNGLSATSPIELRDGDIVCFASIATRYQAARASGGQALPAPVQYDIASQEAAEINNVGRDQYQYNQFIQRRESFMREVAASRTRARHLIVWGFVLFIAGAGTYGWAILRFVGDDFFNENFDEAGFESDVPRLFGPDVGGIPVGLIGFAVAFIGMVMLIVGIALHVVATSRQRRFDREQPYPPMPSMWPGR